MVADFRCEKRDTTQASTHTHRTLTHWGLLEKLWKENMGKNKWVSSRALLSDRRCVCVCVSREGWGRTSQQRRRSAYLCALPVIERSPARYRCPLYCVVVGVRVIFASDYHTRRVEGFLICFWLAENLCLGDVFTIKTQHTQKRHSF